MFGIGSFTYQHVTRDNFGFAVKSTAGAINGEVREIFKSPKTDSGTKRSARGFIRVEGQNGRYQLRDRQPRLPDGDDDALVEVFRDGKLLVETTIAEVRARLLEG